jgi:hypothetical protein
MAGRTYPNWPLRNITLKHFHYCGHNDPEDVLCWRAMACALVYSLTSLLFFNFFNLRFVSVLARLVPSIKSFDDQGDLEILDGLAERTALEELQSTQGCTC